MLSVRFGCATDVGRLRSENQDSMYAGHGLYLVADGMGGQPAGEVASKLVIAELSNLTERVLPPRPGASEPAPAGPGSADVGSADAGSAGTGGAGIAAMEPVRLTVAALEAGIRRANDRLLAEGRQDPERYGMGTTLAGLAWVDGDRWAVLNIGDSRVYRYADGRLEQLTVDHSAVQQLVDAGLLDPRAALRHPRRNVVTRSLGTQPPPAPDIMLRDPAAGERFLVCSDGLTNELSDTEIALLLQDNDDPQQAASQLVERAVRAGGRDNVTVLVVQLDEAG